MIDENKNVENVPLDEVTIIIPIVPEKKNNNLEKILIGDDKIMPTTERIDQLVSEKDIILQSVHDDPIVTLEEFREHTGLEPDEAITLAAECGAFWKRFGVEVIIHSVSFGGAGFAAGLVIKFLKTDPVLGMLLSNFVAVFANENAKVFFDHLLNPPEDKIPLENKAKFEFAKKYAFYPLAVVFSSIVSGIGVMVVNDPDLGTRLALGAGTSQLGGPVTGIAHNALRKHYGGTIIMKPDRVGVKEAMIKYYSTKENPKDENRPYLVGNMRNTLTRMGVLTVSTLCTWYIGFYGVEIYCGDEGRRHLENITRTTGNYTGQDVNEYCLFGSLTYPLREVAIGAIKAIAVMFLQPVANTVFNKIYDYFYPPQQPDEEDVRIVDVTDGDPNDQSEHKIVELDDDSEDKV